MHDSAVHSSAGKGGSSEEFGPVMPATLREALSRFASGIVVITVGGSDPHAMTANAFTSVSLDPPSVLCCVSHAAVMHGAIEKSRSFGISVLTAEQKELAAHFANKKRPLGIRQFDDVHWQPGEHTGAPLLAGALAWLECDLADMYVAGDHSIFLANVLASTIGRKRSGLLFFEGAFREIPSSPHAPR
ncbi:MULTISPECIES: flavin reductase family protein [unclassified Streptomyces]|uniref:flavin reductase family protein n=1 Tax=unclassified Streptomyces TaxID=2593676 RepID=UPI0037A41F9B